MTFDRRKRVRVSLLVVLVAALLYSFLIWYVVGRAVEEGGVRTDPLPQETR